MARAPGGTPAQRTMLATLNDRPDDEFVYTIGRITEAVRLKLAPAIPNEDDWEAPDGWVEHFAAVITTRSWWNKGKKRDGKPLRDPRLMLLFVAATGTKLLPEWADRVLRQHLCEYTDALVPYWLHDAPPEERESWTDAHIEGLLSNYLSSNDRAASHPDFHSDVMAERRRLQDIRSEGREYTRLSLSWQERTESLQEARRNFPEVLVSDEWVEAADARAMWNAVSDTNLSSRAVQTAAQSWRMKILLRFADARDFLLAAPILLSDAKGLGLSYSDDLRRALIEDGLTDTRDNRRNLGAAGATHSMAKARRVRDMVGIAAAAKARQEQPPITFIRKCLELGLVPDAVMVEFRRQAAGFLAQIRREPASHGILYELFLLAFAKAFRDSINLAATITYESLKSGGVIETLTTPLEVD